MANCEYSSSCIFFTTMDANMPKTSEFIRSRFCNGKYESCSRFLAIRSLGIWNVPDTLPPARFRSPGCFYGL
jgi:hypothetical protein